MADQPWWEKLGGMVGSALKSPTTYQNLLGLAVGGLGGREAALDYMAPIEAQRQHKALQQLAINMGVIQPGQALPGWVNQPQDLLALKATRKPIKGIGVWEEPPLFGPVGEMGHVVPGTEPPKPEPKTMTQLEWYVSQHPEDAGARAALEQLVKDETRVRSAAAQAGAEAAYPKEAGKQRAIRESNELIGAGLEAKAAELDALGQHEEANRVRTSAAYFGGGTAKAVTQPLTAADFGAREAAKLDAQQQAFIKAGTQLGDMIDVLNTTNPGAAARLRPYAALAQSGFKPFDVKGTPEEIAAQTTAKGTALQDLAKQIAPGLRQEEAALRAQGKTELADRLGYLAGQYEAGVQKPTYGPKTAEEIGAAAGATAAAVQPFKLELQQAKDSAQITLEKLRGSIKSELANTLLDKRTAAQMGLKDLEFVHAKELKGLDQAGRERLFAKQSDLRIALKKMDETAAIAQQTQRAADRLAAQHDAQAAAKIMAEYKGELDKAARAERRAARKEELTITGRQKEHLAKRAEQAAMRTRRTAREALAGKDMQTSLEGLRKQGLSFRDPVSGAQIRSEGKVKTGADAIASGGVAFNKQDDTLFTNRETTAEMSQQMLGILPNLTQRDLETMRKRVQPNAKQPFIIAAGGQVIQQWEFEVQANDSPPLKQYLALMKKIQVEKIRELFPTGRLPVYDQQLFMGKDISPRDTLEVQYSQLKSLRETALQQMKKMLSPTTVSPFGDQGQGTAIPGEVLQPGEIWVIRKSDHRTGTMQESDFDPTQFDRMQ